MQMPVGERRARPRYPVDTRLFASIDGQTVRLNNISQHGVAICGNGLVAGSAHLLELNIRRTHVTVPIEILDCSGGALLHARFVDPPAVALSLIEDYIADRS